MLSQREQATIERYNKDIETMGGYIYTGCRQQRSTAVFNKRASLAIAKLLSFKGKTVLDVGCGDGTYSIELFARFGAAQVHGIEPSDAWHHAVEKYADYSDHVHFQKGSIYELPFSDGVFDTVMLRGVLHHLDHPERGIQEVLRVGREVFVLEPNGYNVVLKIIEKLSPYHRAHNEKSFAPRTIKRWFASQYALLSGESYSSLVPLLCPSFCVGFLDWLSPRWEMLPILPRFSCGLYCAVFKKSE